MNVAVVYFKLSCGFWLFGEWELNCYDRDLPFCGYSSCYKDLFHCPEKLLGVVFVPLPATFSIVPLFENLKICEGLRS